LGYGVQKALRHVGDPKKKTNPGCFGQQKKNKSSNETVRAIETCWLRLEKVLPRCDGKYDKTKTRWSAILQKQEHEGLGEHDEDDGDL
jgi:hypothetical protein